MAKRVELLVDMGLNPHHPSKKLGVTEHSYDSFLGWLETGRLIDLVVRQLTAKVPAPGSVKYPPSRELRG